MPHMSSEESDQEDGRLLYVVKTIPWKGEELKKRKGNVDRIHTKTNPNAHSSGQ